MELKEYFETVKGTGVLATSDKDGKVDAAVFSRPNFLEDGSIAFIMRDRLTHSYLQTNPYAAYLFIEETEGYKGKRLFLKKIREEKDTAIIAELKRRKLTPDEEADKGPKYLVVFHIERVLPLIGS